MFELYCLPSTPDPTSPSFVYPASLFSLDLGYALWYPEPHETGEPQIGDVGYINGGAFIRLFNVNESKPEHEVVFWKDETFIPTETPSPTVFRLDRRNRPVSNGHYHSRGVRKRDIGGSISAGVSEAIAALSTRYTCKETHGALLVLQSEGRSESVFEGRRLKRYIAQYHESWNEYVRDVLDHHVREEDIILVGGWVKTAADWAAMAFSNTSTKHHASLKGTVGGFMGIGLFGSRTRKQSGARSYRTGTEYSKSDHDTHSDLPRDQSMFIKRYKIKRRLIVLKTIVAGAGHHTLPDPDNEDRGRGLAALDDISVGDGDDGLRLREYKIVDPLDVLLDYILEVSGAEVAVACDQDLESILGIDMWPVDLSTYLRRVQPPVEVQNRHGAISVSELLSRQQLKPADRRAISAADVSDWPNISYEHAASSEISPVQFTEDPELSRLFPTKWRYLRCDPPPNTPPTDGLVLPAFAISRDGKLLALLEDHAIRVRRLSDGLMVQEILHADRPGSFSSICFSPDSRKLMTGSTDMTATIWDVRSGNPAAHLVGHQSPVNHVAYLADGIRVATAAGNSSLRFWDARTGAPICHFPLSRRIDRLLLSADGSRLAISMERSVALFDTTSGKPLVRLGVISTPSFGDVQGAALSPHGDRLVILGLDEAGNSGNIYDTTSCRLTATLERLGRTLVSAVFSPEGDEFATTGETVGLCVFWDVATGAISNKRQMLSSKSAVAYSPDGRFLATGGGADGSEVRAWSRDSDEVIVHYKPSGGKICHIEFLPDSRSLFTMSATGEACVWNVGDALRVR
ncbi:WD40 repeat domain-containing protein [Phanerochaete sordida]|uniref:WD40 repeat domain-containing protein n=1 Tax=Phanerochaete sordida TaxID=48140 RepID=A0A9P3LH46_9APHY|nr:WD40 repeat domain-containing protein [Phanerochaete sordida]